MLNALVDRSGVTGADVEDVVVGCVSQFGEQGANLARLAVLAAGWDPDLTGGVTLNRFCGSGQQAVNFAAMAVLSGFHDVVIGAGVESMSRVAMGADKGGLHGHNPSLNELHPLVPQGVSGDLIAAVEGFTRSDLDEFSLRSQQRAAAAQATGRFRSIVPVSDPNGNVLLDRDEHVRPGTTREGLAALPPAFAGALSQVARGDTLTFGEKASLRYPDTTVEPLHTAGSSSGIVDGAGAVLVVSSDYAKAHGLTPRAKVVATGLASVDPVIMLTAPGPATKKALKKAGLRVSDIDLFEVNEAFAAVPLKYMKDLSLDPDKVNVNGGAIALGHPIGATGAMLFSSIIDELELRDQRRGLITMCIGGGQGTATVVERV